MNNALILSLLGFVPRIPRLGARGFPTYALLGLRRMAVAGGRVRVLLAVSCRCLIGDGSSDGESIVIAAMSSQSGCVGGLSSCRALRLV